MTLIEPAPAGGYAAAPPPVFRAAAPAAPGFPASAAPASAVPRRGGRLALAAALGALALLLLGACAAAGFLSTPAGQDWVRLILGL
jgi:hypothetical protein